MLQHSVIINIIFTMADFILLGVCYKGPKVQMFKKKTLTSITKYSFIITKNNPDRRSLYTI